MSRFSQRNNLFNLFHLLFMHVTHKIVKIYFVLKSPITQNVLLVENRSAWSLSPFSPHTNIPLGRRHGVQSTRITFILKLM